MKVLFVDTFCHRKNKLGVELLGSQTKIDLRISRDLSDFSDSYDLVIIPSELIPHEYFPNTKRILYGPHNFVFANGIWKGPQQRFPSHCYYNVLSPWVDQLQKEFGGLSLQAKALPFPVDVDRFCPSLEPAVNDCFLYLKGRNQELYAYAQQRLRAMGFQFQVIQYGSYTEEEFLQVLRRSRFGVWVGCHESQGFALEEALSTNVPLAVWNVRSMFDEYNRENERSYKEDPSVYRLHATSVSYWDARCGEVFYTKEEFDETVRKVSANANTGIYQPREFIQETLSPKACYKRLLTLFEDIPALSNTVETQP